MGFNYSKSNLRLIATAMALPLVTLGVFATNTHQFSPWLAHGPIQAGHKSIECIDCHQPGDGTTRQQTQANLFFALGLRENSVEFGYRPVTSQECLHCHERPNDRHPIYRFNEPRFSKARNEISANTCFGCHSEHQNRRVSSTATFCSNCHQELQLKDDPLDQSHATLVEYNEWESCLGCHDFHGNHTHEPQLLVENAFDTGLIQDYLVDGPDPYGESKVFKAVSND